MDVQISVSGASSTEIARGLAAAEFVFARHGVTAVEVAQAGFAIEGWDIEGFPPDRAPSERIKRIHLLWHKADRAAVDACCQGWDPINVPTTANLELTLQAIQREYGEETARRYLNWPE
jgi:hypothetical protein